MLCVGTRVTTRGSSDSENSVSNPVNDGEASQIRIRRKKKKKKRGGRRREEFLIGTAENP